MSFLNRSHRMILVTNTTDENFQSRVSKNFGSLILVSLPFLLIPFNPQTAAHPLSRSTQYVVNGLEAFLA